MTANDVRVPDNAVVFGVANTTGAAIDSAMTRERAGPCGCIASILGGDHEPSCAEELSLNASPQGGEVGATIYVEARECENCYHAGINDSHASSAACLDCDWSGPSPTEDRCPSCNRTGVMTVACPKCEGRYRLIAENDIAITHHAAPAPSGEVEQVARELLAAEYVRAGQSGAAFCVNSPASWATAETACAIRAIVAALNAQHRSAGELSDEDCIAIYGRVTGANFTRDVKTDEKKIATVRAALQERR